MIFCPQINPHYDAGLKQCILSITTRLSTSSPTLYPQSRPQRHPPFTAMGKETLPACYGLGRGSAGLLQRPPALCGLSLWPAMVLSALCGLQRLCRRCIRGGNHRRYCQALAGHGAGGCLRGDRLRGPPPRPHAFATLRIAPSNSAFSKNFGITANPARFIQKKTKRKIERSEKFRN